MMEDEGIRLEEKVEGALRKLLVDQLGRRSDRKGSLGNDE